MHPCMQVPGQTGDPSSVMSIKTNEFYVIVKMRQRRVFNSGSANEVI